MDKVAAFVKELDAFDAQIDRVIEASNGLSANQLVALLPRLRLAIEKLDEHIPLQPGDLEDEDLEDEDLEDE